MTCHSPLGWCDQRGCEINGCPYTEKCAAQSKTTQELFWTGQSGNDYTKRNQVKWRERVPFWRRVLTHTLPNNVMEIGCNEGWNLRAIRETSPGTVLMGIDINHEAVRRAKQAGFDVHWKEAREIPFLGIDFDLAFTVGMLIHVPPEHLTATMRSIVQCSSRYVLAVEYEASTEEEIEYRGMPGLLWRRPFGQIYVQDHGLKLVDSWDAGPGFDRCTAWLLEIA